MYVRISHQHFEIRLGQKGNVAKARVVCGSIVIKAVLQIIVLLVVQLYFQLE